MNLEQFMELLGRDSELAPGIDRWEHILPKPASYGAWPEELSPKLRSGLEKRGFYKPYTHQEEAVRAAEAGKDFVVVTPTASGKSLCYNVPVLDAIAKDSAARALYIFPTKALAQDQATAVNELAEAADIEMFCYTYDGDTPANVRNRIREAGNIVVTNPDMLHSGILPHHTAFVRLFENLKYVVIDELHIYRGVFGSNMANVLRRLQRICAFYGTHPTFICCSATIANPGELFTGLTGREPMVIDRSGAPEGEKHILFYNPPLLSAETGVRASAADYAERIAAKLIGNGIQTIVFTRSRVMVEVILRGLRMRTGKGFAAKADGSCARIEGYRGGYLPEQRRAIERGLRSGEITGVVSTNALELGIDIGGLSASITCGYPGGIASLRQQMGRAGRHAETAVSILVAENAPLDQFMMRNPDYFFGASPETGIVNPDNLYILSSHIKCAVFECPFREGEKFGDTEVDELLDYYAQQGIFRHTGNRYYYSVPDNYPAHNVSLRSPGDDNFIIVDITDTAHHRVIGEMDRYGAPMLLHKQAIYMHMGTQYQVEELDFENKKAYVRRVEVDYYTDANLDVTYKVLSVEEECDKGRLQPAWGEVMLSSAVTFFKKMKLDTHENIGWGQVHLPELELHTEAFWISMPAEYETRFGREGLQDALLGLCFIYPRIASLRLMCDPADIKCIMEMRSDFTGKPTLTVYERNPGGVGLAAKLYSIHALVLEECLNAIRSCPCESGCPSCTGPSRGRASKSTACKLIEAMLSEERE